MNVGDAALHQLFDRLERLPWPNPLMGKLEDDEQKLIKAIDRWTVLVEPWTDVEKSLRRANPDTEELEARAELVLAAAAWAYWKRDPWLVTHPAIGTEARRAETENTGSVYDGPDPKGIAQP
jgi:hypothetical protein